MTQEEALQAGFYLKPRERKSKPVDLYRLSKQLDKALKSRKKLDLTIHKLEKLINIQKSKIDLILTKFPPSSFN